MNVTKKTNNQLNTDDPLMLLDASDKQQSKIGSIVIFSMLCVFALIQLFPLYWLITFSLKDNYEIFGGNVIGLPNEWQFSNYVTALTSGRVLTYFTNSVVVTSLTILVTSVLVTTTSYAIARMRWKLSGAALVYFLIGMMVPIHATLLPLFMILRRIGILNSQAAIIIPYVAFAIPLGILVMTGFLDNIPKELEEAACIDGSSVYTMLIKIILPLMRPALATIAIFTYMSSWNELMFANTFINSDSLKTLPVGIFSMVNENATEWGPIGAGLVIATFPTIIMYIFVSGQVQKSLLMGAVKG